MQDSKIEWCKHTFNPWIGCTKVSDGCKFCYAENLMDHRYGKVQWGPNGTRIRTSPANWNQPLKWDREAKALGERHRVFCASLADVFEDREELLPWRRDLFKLIQKTPNLDWLLLTKRPENVLGMTRAAIDSPDPDYALYFPTFAELFPNVWLGTSIENQDAADKRIPELLKIPAAVRFLSIEPLLGPVDLLGVWQRSQRTGEFSTATATVDWAIVGGESGNHARPVNPAWVRSLRAQCQTANVPFFFKQWGEFLPATLTRDVLIGQNGREYPTFAADLTWTPSVPLERIDGEFSIRVGKHTASRMLDGRTWDEFPRSPPGENPGSPGASRSPFTHSKTKAA